MRILKPTYEIVSFHGPDYEGVETIYERIESAARTCYKSETWSDKERCHAFVGRLVSSGHEAMLEHAFITVKFFVDRGISHEIVRHRMASFAQESTRYCNYSKGKFGEECSFADIQGGLALEGITNEEQKEDIIAEWISACKDSEYHYMRMLRFGATPQMARSVLNNSLMTELVVTANVREWRHILKLRAADETGKAHPQMKEVMVPLLMEFKKAMPELFGDIICKE